MAGRKILITNSATGFPVEYAVLQASAGAGSAGEPIGADAGGKIDQSWFPTGIGPDILQATASEAIGAGALVNLYLTGGVLKVRNADASSPTKLANGFASSAISNAATGTIYSGSFSNTWLAGLTIGTQWLSATTPGACQATPPTASGATIQMVGVAVAAADLRFTPMPPSYQLA